MQVVWKIRRWLARRKFIEQGRRRRYELFAALCLRSSADSIVDVGSGGGTLLERYNAKNPITALDLVDYSERFNGEGNVRFVQGDATAMPFADGAFDVAFSNSVIEHLPLALREAYAREIRRVGKRYFVQTPNRYFPVEPHFWLPLVQFLPQRVQRWLEQHLLGGEEIHLLTVQEMERLFPDAEIQREKVFGLTKSLAAIRL